MEDLPDPAVQNPAAAPLAKPSAGRLRVLLDTDTYNEVDDQFALAHLLLSPDRIEIEGVTAAPFHNKRSTGPADGMERSHEEILRLLALLRLPANPPVRRGATRYMRDVGDVVESEAVDFIIERARAGPADRPLYVAAIGAATNVGSALAKAPDIAGRIVLVWLGAHAHDWPAQNEFNFLQDIPAASLLFTAGAPLVQVPCRPVASHLLTTIAELRQELAGQGPLAEFLLQRVVDYSPNTPAWSKVIWDIAVSAWLVDPSWLPSRLMPATVPGQPAPERHDGRQIRQVYHLDRDSIFADLFGKLRRHHAAGARS
jgi:inosine-uridine nucleoside N-ribohydrolase